MRIQSTDGVAIELHDLGGDGPPVLIGHATGFCAGAYRPLATALAADHHGRRSHWLRCRLGNEKLPTSRALA